MQGSGLQGSGLRGYGLLVRFTVRAGHETAFDALAAETLTGIRELEPGTLIYVTHTLADQPRLRVFYELYQDHDAFVAHEEQPHTRRFLGLRDEYVESFTVDVLDVLNGKA